MEKKVENMVWVLVGLLATVVAISLALWAISVPAYGGGFGQFGMMGYGFYGMWILMPVAAGIGVILVLVFVYLLVDILRTAPAKPADAAASRALEIAAQRYAKGEISEEEYRAIKRNL